MSRTEQSLTGAALGVEHTIASRQRDFPEWHLGRPVFSVWAVALANPALEERLGQVRGTLDGLLLRGYERQPHITLHVCGFPATTTRRGDDFTIDELRAQVEALARSGITAFDVRVAEPFTFTSAACLSVEDAASSVICIRSVWDWVAPSCDKTHYVPNVTAGLYAAAWPLAEVEARLQSIPGLPTLALRVRSVDCMCYDSTRIAGPLRTVVRFDLDRQRAYVVDGARLRRAFGA